MMHYMNGNIVQLYMRVCSFRSEISIICVMIIFCHMYYFIRNK